MRSTSISGNDVGIGVGERSAPVIEGSRATFELTIGDIRGMMNLCIPYNSIERIGGKLSANSWSAYGRQKATPESIKKISEALCASMIELKVQLARTQIDTGDLIGLRVGDIITTQDLFTYEFEGEDRDGMLLGSFRSSGLRPQFAEKAAYFGLERPLIEAV